MRLILACVVGRFSHASACLAAARSGCDDHVLQTVTVAAGGTRDVITLNDGYADPHDGQLGPQEPRGEAVPAR